jgi:hypothetical protein
VLWWKNGWLAASFNALMKKFKRAMEIKLDLFQDRYIQKKKTISILRSYRCAFQNLGSEESSFFLYNFKI